MKNIFLTNRKMWIAALMTLCFALPALAQSLTVSGTVVDPEGEPLIGASVIVQGQSMGTATDIDGQYRISVPADGVLIFSYVGYDTQEIPVAGQTTINVYMKENALLLGEVVAIGYGTVKKSDATGSVAVVKPDEIAAGLATSAQDLLVGASPGVVVTTNGDPTATPTSRYVAAHRWLPPTTPSSWSTECQWTQRASKVLPTLWLSSPPRASSQ